MTILLADKQVFPMELLELGPLIFEPKHGYIQVEKLPGEEHEDQGA